MNVIVIGGGIAGLSAAYYLNKKAQETGKEIAITVLESADYWGGKIKTTIEDGFVVEGGPDAYLVTKPWMRTLVHELGMADDLQGTNPDLSETFVLHKGKLTSIPEGLTMTIPTKFGPMLTTKLMTWPQKMRMGLDFIIPVRKDKEDESLAGFISRRLGRAAYESLVGPLLSGIYAGDGDKLSLQSTFPNLREMELEHGGLIKGALALKLKRARMAKQRSAASNGNGSKPRSRSIFESPKSGLVSVVNGMVETLTEAGVEMSLNTQVRSAAQTIEGYKILLSDGTELICDALVVAVPAFAAGEIFENSMPDLASLLKDIQYATTATVSLAFRKSDLPAPLNGYGYIIPQHENSKALACTWTSSKWNERSPDDHVLIRVFIGRIQDVDKLPEDEFMLVAMALEEIRETMGLTASPMNSWVFRWEKAMPQYNLGHPARLEKINAIVEDNAKLALAGNGYAGIGMPDCIRSGIEAADKLLELA